MTVLVACSLAGCGGSGAPKATAVLVRGHGYTFEAPAGWQTTRAAGRTTVSQGSDLVEVSAFPLIKPYRPALFGRVASELAQRMDALAQQTGGHLDGSSTVVASGIRAHSYRVTTGDHVDEYTFVLRGLHEYQLLCRHSGSGSAPYCAQLVSSFRTRA